jgi:hypothetical protein
MVGDTGKRFRCETIGRQATAVHVAEGTGCDLGENDGFFFFFFFFFLESVYLVVC